MADAPEDNLYSELLGVLDVVTSEVIPALGVAPHRLTIITRTWSGGGRDLGVATDVALPLVKKHWVRELKTAEIANSGGRYEAGDIEVSGLVPNHPINGPSEGYSEAQLSPLVKDPGVEIIYRLTTSGGGAHQGDYELVHLASADPWEWKLVLRRSRTTPHVLSPLP